MSANFHHSHKLQSPALFIKPHNDKAPSLQKEAYSTPTRFWLTILKRKAAQSRVEANITAQTLSDTRPTSRIYAAHANKDRNARLW